MKYSESQLATGTTFEGRYETISKLGEGGFGTVYKARQLSTGQLVALKLMRLPDYGGEAQRKTRLARFLREARLCAQLHHPNIVQVIDAGQLDDGGLYTVFAFAPGDTLSAVLAKEGNLAPDEARHLMLQVLDALACAHAQGVVHRDLKPSNIMIVPTGARRNAVVLDFGIGAMFGGDSKNEGPRLTGTNETVGTPGYCAPEQLRGLEASPRADLFSWAIVLVECLTGRPLYTGSSAETLYQMLASDPVPLPPVLEALPIFDLLVRATRKDVSGRDVTAKEALAALEAWDLRGLTKESLRGFGASGSKEQGAWPSLELAPEAGGSRTTPRTTPTGDRRHLTVLCCQLAVRADGGGPVDIEEQDNATRATLAVCGDVARDHGGRIMAALGDRLLIYFGYPRAQEDDPHRAARAALAIADAVRERAASSTKGIQVDVSMGIHTGPVASDDERLGSAGLVVGATPLFASKVAAASPPGAIALSVDAEKLLRNKFEVEPKGEWSLLLGERDLNTTGTRGDASRVVVGRDQEVELLVERWRRLTNGSGQCSLITGEAGIGKSALVRELRRRLSDEDHGFLESRCSPDTQHAALFPVVDLLHRRFGLDQEADAAAKTARLERELAGYELPLSEVMPLFLPLFSLPLGEGYVPLDVSPQRQKDLTLDALLALISSMAERRPLVVLVEDLHWADATTLELLTKLAREISSSRTLLIMTARPEFEPSFATTGMLQLHLSRLEPSHVEAMVAEVAGGKRVPAEVIQRVISRTDGVPLFVEELTRMVLESGVLTERDGRYELSGELSNVEIPTTLRGLLTTRLDRLDRAKGTAQVAAALGREFSLEVLAAASPLGPVAVQEDLEKLTSAGLVLRKRRLRDPIGVFKHALVRDAVYESLSRPARQEVHLRIARTLEEHFSETTRTRPDLLALHYAAADQKQQAVLYSNRAAQQALQRTAYADAIAHASKVVEWVGSIKEPERVEVELSANGVLSQALMAMGGWADTRVKEIAERSGVLVHQLDVHNPHRVTNLWALFAYHHVAGHRAAARAVAEELVTVTDATGDSGLRAAAIAMLGCAQHAEGRFVACKRSLERVVELYDPNLHRQQGPQFGLDSLVIAKTLLGHLHWFEGDSRRAFESVAEGIRWARAIGHVPTMALGLMYGCHVHQFSGDKENAAAMTGEILGLSAKYGLPAYEGYAAIVHGWATGNHEQAESIVSVLVAMGCKLTLSYYASLSGETLAERGDLDGAIKRVDYSLSLCRENDEHSYEAELHRRRALYERRRDPTAPGIRTSLEAAARLAKEYENPRAEAAALTDLVESFSLDQAQGARLKELMTLYPGLRDL